MPSASTLASSCRVRLTRTSPFRTSVEDGCPQLHRAISSFASMHRDREREGRSAAHLALYPDFSPVQLDEPAAKGQPEPGPLGLLLRSPDLPKLLEHRFLILRR